MKDCVCNWGKRNNWLWLHTSLLLLYITSTLKHLFTCKDFLFRSYYITYEGWHIAAFLLMPYVIHCTDYNIKRPRILPTFLCVKVTILSTDLGFIEKECENFNDKTCGLLHYVSKLYGQNSMLLTYTTVFA